MANTLSRCQAFGSDSQTNFPTGLPIPGFVQHFQWQEEASSSKSLIILTRRSDSVQLSVCISNPRYEQQFAPASPAQPSPQPCEKRAETFSTSRWLYLPQISVNVTRQDPVPGTQEQSPLSHQGKLQSCKLSLASAHSVYTRDTPP